MIRTHEAGALRGEHAGTRVVLAGWVARRRDHPGFVVVVPTDTVPPPVDWPELQVRTVSRLFAEAIARIHAGESVSSLFDGVDPAHAPPQPKLPL